MIAVDTSALLAIVLDEAEAESCAQILNEADTIVVSAVTLAEAFIVAAARDVSEELAELVDLLGMEVDAVDEIGARRVSETYTRWGRGFHPAGLNFGDCFAYNTAQAHGCPLLYIGDDFAQTDVRSALDA